jgi:hypothetical protein
VKVFELRKQLNRSMCIKRNIDNLLSAMDVMAGVAAE